MPVPKDSDTRKSQQVVCTFQGRTEGQYPKLLGRTSATDSPALETPGVMEQLLLPDTFQIVSGPGFMVLTVMIYCVSNLGKGLTAPASGRSIPGLILRDPQQCLSTSQLFYILSLGRALCANGFAKKRILFFFSFYVHAAPCL